MGNKIYHVDGMPVEVPGLDADGERERRRLNALAMQEYEDTGALTSEKLLEANKDFIETAKKHLLGDDAEYQ